MPMPLFWELLAIIAILLLIRAWWEPTRLECRTVKVEQADADRPAKPLRILFFSDLHAEFFRLPIDQLLKACAQAKPDLVLFAGDLTGRQTQLPKALAVMQQIRALPEISKVPFLAVRGNHDTEESVNGLQQLGIQVLDNTIQAVRIHGQDWLMIGLQDLRTGQPDLSSTLQLAEAANIPPARRIVLSHNPDTLLDMPEGAVAYFLAGHFHGGQIWLPFRLEFFLLRHEKLPKIGYYKGSFNWQGTPVYISRGLGCVQLPLRLFSRPELTLLEIS